MNGLSCTRRVVACVAIGVLALAACGDDDDDNASSSLTTDAASTADVATTAAVETTVAVATTAAPVTTSESPSGTPAAGSGDMCADREALSASVAALGDVNIRAEGTNGVKSAVDAVKTNLAALRGSVSADLRPQVDAVQTAVDAVEMAAASLGSGGAAATITAVQNLATATTTLVDSLQAGACG